MNGVRDYFVQRFGEAEAVALETAALKHADDDLHANRGSDPFKWTISIVIGYQCAEVDGYRQHHGITAPWAEIQEWIRDEAQLASHDGDVDYLALFIGKYDGYLGSPDEARWTPELSS